MEKKNRLAFVYLLIGVAFLFGWPFVQNKIWPPPEKPKVAKPEEWLAQVGGGLPVAAQEVEAPRLAQEERVAEERKRVEKHEAERKVEPAKPATLLAMGKG